LTVYSTYGWGCPAPPFALAKTVEADEQMLATTFAAGVPDPEKEFWHQGRFELKGHFTGQMVDFEEWHRKQRGRAAGEGACKGKLPEFVVTSWCYADPPIARGSERSDVPMDRAKHARFACKR